MREPQSPAKLPEQPSGRVDCGEALSVARYVADMIPQLEAMAIKGRLDLVIYFLGMVKVEADRFVQTNLSTEDESKAPGEQSEDGGFTEGE